MPKVCIIIPFYNEAGRIAQDAFTAFLQQQPDYSLLLVNDGSTDNTGQALEQMQQRVPEQIKLHHLPLNSGKAEAVRQGVLQALEWDNFDFLGYMDADLATPLNEAPYLTKHFENAGLMFISGSRVKLFGWNIKRSLKRHYFGRIFATVVSSLFHLDIYDTQCGAKFFRADIANDLFDKSFVSKWFFDIELFLRLRKELGQDLFDKSLKEVPLRNWEEQGNSKLNLSDFLNTPFELLKIKRNYPD
jgi:glycosyltransferase involved in cell wall biosynthesis